MINDYSYCPDSFPSNLPLGSPIAFDQRTTSRSRKVWKPPSITAVINVALTRGPLRDPGRCENLLSNRSEQGATDLYIIDSKKGEINDDQCWINEHEQRLTKS